jgi:multidrug efflux pump subunit AcrB
MKQTQADGLKLSADLDARFAALNKEFGGRLHFSKWDLSDFVRGSIRGIMTDIVMGILIILAIIYYVMVRLRYSLPIMIILPVVLISEFVAMKLLGMTINIMTLGGLSAAIGIIADNAIVITENYVRFRAEGDPAPLASSMQYIVPITVWATLVSIIVFIPLNILSGVSGLFFLPLALTLATTIVISLVAAVSLLPVLIYYFIEKGSAPAGEERERRLFSVLKKGYLRMLDTALRHGRLVAVGIVLLLAGAWLVFFRLPTGFLPEWDEGDIVFDYIAPSGTSIEAVDAMVEKAEKIISDEPETAMYVRKTGVHMGTPFAPPSVGEIVVLLKKDRSRSTFEVMDDLREKTGKAVPELDTDLHQILPDRLGDLTGNVKPIVVSVIGNDLDEAWTAARVIKDKLSKIDGLNGVMIDLPPVQKEIKVVPDQKRLSLLGLTSADAFRYSGIALYGEVMTYVQRGLQMIPVRAIYSGDFRSDEKAITRIPVYTPNGGVLPLGRFTSFKTEEQVPEIHHKNGSIVVSVNAEIDGRALGDVVKDVNTALATVPRGDYSVELEGNYKEQQKSFGELMFVLGISVLLILLLLLYIFESYLTSLAVFAGTLASATFVIFGLKLSGIEFDVSSFTGMITVMGIVVNNGILVIDFAERYRAEGMELLTAVKAAGALRFRPVLITNLAAIAGFLPMALNIGHGGEVLRPFSVAMISGLFGSMFFSLMVIPVLYLLLHKLRKTGK